MSNLSLIGSQSSAIISNEGILVSQNGIDGRSPVFNINSFIINKGLAVLSVNPVSPVAGWLYRAAELGSYSNLSISASIGDLLLYNGSSWQKVLYSEILENSAYLRGKNLYNPITRNQNQYVNHTTGNLSANASYDCTDYIEVIPGSTYTRTSVLLDRMAFYDINKSFVSGVNPGTATFTIPANCFYVRIAIYKPAIDPVTKFQLEIGNSETYFEPYGIYVKGDFTANSSISGASIIDASLNYEKTNFFAIGKNKYNPFSTGIFPEGVNDGFKIKNDGTVDSFSASTESASDFFKVKPSQQYKCNQYVSGLAFYDINKKFIVGSWTGFVTAPVVTSPASAVYCRLSFDKTKKGSFQIEEGAAATFYERFQVQPQQQIGISNTLNYQDLPRMCNVDILLPQNIYITAGHERTLYLGQVFRSNFPISFYNINISCPTLQKGKFFGGENMPINGSAFNISPYYQWIATDVINADAGTHPFTIQVFLDNILVYTKTINIIVSSTTVGNGVTRQMLAYGESTSYSGLWQQEVQNLFTPDVMNLTTAGSIQNPAGIFHEGYNGFNWDAHLTNPLSNILNGGVVDMNNYQSTFGVNLNANDWMICLGFINDIQGQNTLNNYAAVESNIDYYISRLVIGINHFMTKYPGIRVGICTPICPPSPDAWGYLYGGLDGLGGQNAIMRSKMVAKKIIEMFDTPAYAALGIYVVEVMASMDSVYGYPRVSIPINGRTPLITRSVNSDPLHPTFGYLQVADSIYDFIKAKT